MITAKKRANGEGSLRKRSDGRWEGRYTAGRDPVTGKAIYKNVLAKTQKECKEKLAQAIEKSGKIDVAKSGQYTVEEWCWLWHENYCKPAVKDSTAEYYRSYIEHHIAPNIGKIKLEKLTTLDLNVIKLRVSSKLWGTITFCYYTKTIESTNFFTDQFLEFLLNLMTLPWISRNFTTRPKRAAGWRNTRAWRTGA